MNHPTRRRERADRPREIIWLSVVILLFAVSLGIDQSHAEEVRYSGRLSPTDYLLKSRDQKKDPVFDNYRVVDLGAQIGVGSDCGRIDFKSTLRASLQNVLDAKYFGDLGKNILAASPMLLTCYFSPTWCAILKHSQINANYMAQMRLDQCSIIDKYVDTRVEDYYQERQGCVRREIERNGGDLEHAMESCRGNGLWNADLANWAGPKSGAKASENRLIESSAKWAGLDSSEAKDSVNLVKALVGDTVVTKGSVSVSYGPKRTQPLTPRTYLQSLERISYDKLCKGIVRKLESAGGLSANVDRLVSNEELKNLSPGQDESAIDRQTIRSLMRMNPKHREAACTKLSGAIAMSVFATDVNQSLDILTTLSQNPNLPDNRKTEIEQKRKALKESVEMVVSLQKSRNEPINQVLAQINQEGMRLSAEATREELGAEESEIQNERLRMNLMDCSDGILCEKENP